MLCTKLTIVFTINLCSFLLSVNLAMAQVSTNQTTSDPKTESEDSNKPSILPPLKGYAKRDAKGTPVVPEWKMQAGYDELFGTFYVGLMGFKLFPVKNPPPAAVLGSAPLKHWKGKKPHPCVLTFTKLQDGTGGYYFQTIGAGDGPRGWIMPQPSEPHKARSWAIYFMQEADNPSDSKIKIENKDKN